MQDLKQQLSSKAETDVQNAELEHRQVSQKLREEIVAKDEKIKQLEKQLANREDELDLLKKAERFFTKIK